MTEKDIQESVKRAAKAIAAQMVAFKDQGFTRDEAHALCCAMLSSPVVYTPFAAMAAPTDTRH